MTFRKLRIAWSVPWGVVAVLLCVLWVRSYRGIDRMWIPRSATTNQLFQSSGGTLWTCAEEKYRPNSSMRWAFDYTSYAELTAIVGKPIQRSPASFDWLNGGPLIPHWFAVAITASLTLVPWLHRRFSLRTLLIATTLVAVVLGLIVWLR